MKRLLIAVVLLAGVVIAGPALAQCPMCRTALESSAEGQRIAGDFNHAILLLLAAPYLVFGSVAAALFRGRIRERLARARRHVLPFPAVRTDTP